MKWPCPTMEIVQRHKRAIYMVENESWFHQNFEVCGVYVRCGIGARKVFRGTRIECETWIEEQINNR
jgi:hypothetical protein